MKKAVIFGATGGIGQAVYNDFANAGYMVQAVGRKQIDFAGTQSPMQISELLTQYDPDVVINCAGHFDNNNQESHFDTMNINVGANWSIIKHYMDNKPGKPVKIIMVGSSAYRSGRKDYILYAASKAALYNMWQGAGEYFKDSNVTLGLINPVRTRTSMINVPASTVCLEPLEVAKAILHMTSANYNDLVDMKYPKEK
jgi:short-subunit dehydrogenase